MATQYIRSPQCFLTKKRKRNIAITLVSNKNFADWLKKQDSSIKAEISDTGFEAKIGQAFFFRTKAGKINKIFIGVNDPIELYDLSHGLNKINAAFSSKALKDISFTITNKDELYNAYAGWALACYSFDLYKKKPGSLPRLVIQKSTDKKITYSIAESICLIRDLINTPANDMGPNELELAAKELCGLHDANIKIIGDKKLKTDFPLIFAVGDSSPRRPRLIDISWGDPKNPKITLVGKGVCFDTGGLDLKPSQYMALMKKDMGGAAHVLGLARMIMGFNLPIRLRVLIPAVENSVSGVAFRPGDVFTSRKGISVENTNTDAEGRLILADALTYACEDKPELIIDFATLTGSARAALGADIPAMFCTNDDIGSEIQKASFDIKDPLWQMPLYQPYKKLIEGSAGELVNSAKTPGDLIYSALFLQSFLDGKTDWVHIDCFAWQNADKPGRPKGGADTGMRAIFSFLKNKYEQKP